MDDDLLPVRHYDDVALVSVHRGDLAPVRLTMGRHTFCMDVEQAKAVVRLLSQAINEAI